MASEWATTGQPRSSGPVTPPRQAASVILVRDGDDGLQVLLVRRHPDQRVMAGFWVFPGGTVDAGEGEGDAAHRAAAVRELLEEAGVGGVDPAELVKYSRWITPELLAARFDTHFFLARAPAGARPRPDGVECVEARWLAPQAALAEHERGALALVFPTRTQLEALTAFAAVDTLLAHARASVVRPVRPRIIGDGRGARIVVPDDDGVCGD